LPSGGGVCQKKLDVWLAVLLTAGPGLLIGSGTDCPSAVQVLTQIAPLLPAGVTAAEARGTATSGEDTDRGDVAGDVAMVAIDPQGDRWVRLRGHEQRFNHERTLPSSLSCGEAARTAAVLLAAWEFQGRAATTPPRADAPAATPADPDAQAKVTVVEIVRDEATPPKAEPPKADPSPEAKSAKPAPPETAAYALSTARPTAAIAAPALLAAPPQRRLGLGGGVSAAARTDRLVAGAAAEVIYGAATGIGWRLQAATTSRDVLAIGGGNAI
jgi:hypothetical protein